MSNSERPSVVLEAIRRMQNHLDAAEAELMFATEATENLPERYSDLARDLEASFRLAKAPLAEAIRVEASACFRDREVEAPSLRIDS